MVGVKLGSIVVEWFDVIVVEIWLLEVNFESLVGTTEGFMEGSSSLFIIYNPTFVYLHHSFIECIIQY